jgi:2,3-bisphosphoglycerate-independent phosphoglycerate mutase
MTKIILILLDGLGDRAYKCLNNRTPLQAAHKPHLDRLACLGSNGLFHASSPGQCLPSETAHYLLFGYDPRYFPGRGLLEAVGNDIPFDDKDILSLAHLSSIEWQRGIPILTHGRKETIGAAEEMGRLFSTISSFKKGEISFRLHQTHRNDAILVISGPVSPYISDSDPMVLGRTMAQVQPLLGNPEPLEAKATAQAVNSYLTHCHRTLSDHPSNRLRKEKGYGQANFLATQRAGRRIPQERFQKRWGLSGVLVASSSVYLGLAHELGLTPLKVRDHDDPGDDLKSRIQMALSDDGHNFFHIHTKAPDEAAHSGDPMKKLKAITSLDRGIEDLVKAAEEEIDLLIAITADHSTPSASPLIHSGESVPLTLVGPGVRQDQVDSFDEICAATGCLGFLRGAELMEMLLNYSNRSTLIGHRLDSEERPYFPDDYKPFKLSD